MAIILLRLNQCVLKNANPPIYDSMLYGKRYLKVEDYRRLEADFLKYRHKRATYRQAIGIIGRWDCLAHDDVADDSNKRIAIKWARILNTRISAEDVNNLVYFWVTMREDKAIKFRRPDDSDFRAIAFRWATHLNANIDGDIAEQMLSIYVEYKDFFEPLPYNAA